MYGNKFKFVKCICKPMLATWVNQLIVLVTHGKLLDTPGVP